MLLISLASVILSLPLISASAASDTLDGLVAANPTCKQLCALADNNGAQAAKCHIPLGNNNGSAFFACACPLLKDGTACILCAQKLALNSTAAVIAESHSTDLQFNGGVQACISSGYLNSSFLLANVSTAQSTLYSNLSSVSATAMLSSATSSTVAPVATKASGAMINAVGAIGLAGAGFALLF